MSKFPGKAGDLPGTDYLGNDNIYLLFTLHEADDHHPLTLRVCPKMPFIVTDDNLKFDIYQHTGALMPSLEEVRSRHITAEVKTSWPKVDWHNTFTLGTGVLPLVMQEGEDDMRVLLLQNDGSKPVNKNRWNFPSRLAGSLDVLETVYACLQTEVGLIRTSQPGQTYLTHLIPDLPAEFPHICKAARKRIDHDALTQISNIRHELNKRASGMGAEQLIPETRPARLVDLPQVTTQVAVDILGHVFNAQAHVVVDRDVMSANVHYPMVLAEEPDLLAVDPGPYGKQAVLATLKEADALDLIPAPRDFVQRMRGLG